MIYIILFLYEAVICYFYDMKLLNNKRIFEICDYKLKISTQKGAVSLAIILPLWLVMGLRYNIGVDYKAYENIFRLALIYKRNSYHMELGYYYLNRISANISQNPQIIFFLTAFLIVFFFLKGIEKNNGSMYFGVLAFIGMGYYFYAMNIQRQYIAIMIMFYAIQFLENRNLPKFLVCVAIAASFHLSAIIWIPVYFAINYVPTKIFYVGSMIIAFLINRFSNYVLSVLSYIGFYTGQITKNANFFKARLSISNVLMLGTLLICGVIFREQLQKNGKAVFRFKPIWLAFLTYAFLYTFGDAATRIATYMCPMYFLAISDITSCFDTRSKHWVRVLVTVVLMMLMLVILYVGNDENAYLPYQYRMLWE